MHLPCGLLDTINSPASPLRTSLGWRKAWFYKGLQGIPGNRGDSRSSCHRLLGALPLVALPTMKKQEFARVFHGSSCRSHAAPGVPEDANRTSMVSHVAESLVFPTFWRILGNRRDSGLAATGPWGGFCRIYLFSTVFALSHCPYSGCGR